MTHACCMRNMIASHFQGKTLTRLLELCTELSTLAMKHLILLGKSNRLWLSKLGYLADVFSKVTGVCHFRENNYLLPMIKLKVLREEQDLGNVCHHHEFESFPVLKDFSDGIGVSSNK